MALIDLPRRARSALSLSALSWATAWRNRSREAAPRSGPSIAILGNCQARGIAQALRLLAPSSPVRYLPMGSLKRDHGDLQGLARVLNGHALAFSQVFPTGLVPGGDSAGLRALVPGLRPVPSIVFSAFHPDTVYAGSAGDLAALNLAPSPLGQYHSAIALSAYHLGLDARHTAGLFREEVFARLGYLDHWDPAVRELTTAAAQSGFALDTELTRWARRGTFMHVMNHPKAFVMGDIAKRLLREAGLEPLTVEIEDYLGDELAQDVVWPVYPPIAAQFGLPGSYLFKTRARGDAFPVLYDLAGFIEASFALYGTMPAAALHCPRVEVWLATPEVVDLFRRG